MENNFWTRVLAFVAMGIILPFIGFDNILIWLLGMGLMFLFTFCIV